jgi:hypothetical protein
VTNSSYICSNLDRQQRVSAESVRWHQDNQHKAQGRPGFTADSNLLRISPNQIDALQSCSLFPYVVLFVVLFTAVALTFHGTKRFR